MDDVRGRRPIVWDGVLGKVLGRDLRFEAQPDDEARVELGRSTPADFVDAFFRFFVKGEFDDGVVVGTVEALTGRAPRTFEQWARAHGGEFETSASPEQR